MKIGIDARLLERPTTGVGRYLKNLIRYIPVVDRDDEYVLFSYTSIAMPQGANLKNISTTNRTPRGLWQKIFSPYWMNVVLPRFIKKEKIDIFFSPNHFLPGRSASKKNVIVVHDVFQKVDKRFHSFWYRKYVDWALPRAIRKSDTILTNSECSKRDIIHYLNVPEEKVRVVYLAAEEKFKSRSISNEERDRLQKKYNLPHRFILYVGVIEERKNIEGIIHIAQKLVSRVNVPIVVIGRPGYRGEYYLQKIGDQKNMRYVGAVGDEDLPLLYNLAEIFLFPSWYEGFGLPPLEAMQSGTPVIASNGGALPEVIGEGGIILPPDNIDAFTDAVIALLEDKGKSAALTEKGFAQARKFSYEKMARETIAILQHSLQ